MPPMPAASNVELMVMTSLKLPFRRPMRPSLMRRSATMEPSWPPVSVMSATSFATAVPCPMAMPTSASANAGASLTPSPTMTTCAPCALRPSTKAYLSSGSRFAWNSETPARAAMRAAVRSLSPVSMMTRESPRRRSSAMASGTPALSGSCTPMTPMSLPSTAR